MSCRHGKGIENIAWNNVVGTIPFLQSFPIKLHCNNENIQYVGVGVIQCATDTVSVSVLADISVSVSLLVSADTDFYIGR